MNPERKGEIAVAVLKYMMSELSSSPADRGFQAKLGRVAKLTGIDVQELRQFSREIFEEFLDENVDPPQKPQTAKKEGSV